MLGPHFEIRTSANIFSLKVSPHACKHVFLELARCSCKIPLASKTPCTPILGWYARLAAWATEWMGGRLGGSEIDAKYEQEAATNRQQFGSGPGKGNKDG